MAEIPFKAILFDLDGTLIDTAIDMIHALRTLADNHGIQHNLNVTEYRQHISKGAVALVKSVFDNPTAEKLAQLRQQYLDIYQLQLNTHSQLFPGIEDLILHLNQNNIPWGIVTNKPSWLAKPIVANTPELYHSQVLICADEVGVGKPDPKSLLLAAEQMGLTHKNTLYLGDAKSDIDAAHAAGMQSAIALWGYLAPGDKPDEWLAHFRFAHPDEMLVYYQSIQ
jgi:phosphoglycolate phosphatase